MPKEQKQDPQANQQNPSAGNSVENPSGNPSASDAKSPTQEDIKALQRKLSEKDIEINKLKSKTEGESTVISELTSQIESLSESLNSLINENSIKELSLKYPDITPELLVGKKQEEIEKIVKSQRELNRKNYGDSSKFTIPTYETKKQIDQAKEGIQSSQKSGFQKAVEIMRLNREKPTIN